MGLNFELWFVLCLVITTWSACASILYCRVCGADFDRLNTAAFVKSPNLYQWQDISSLYIYIVHSTSFINKNIQDTAGTTLYVYLLKKKERVNMVNSVLRILKLKGVCVDCTHLLMDLFSGILLGRIIIRGTAKCTENQNWAPKVGNFMFDHGMANHLIFIISVCHWGARNYFFIYN